MRTESEMRRDYHNRIVDIVFFLLTVILQPVQITTQSLGTGATPIKPAFYDHPQDLVPILHIQLLQPSNETRCQAK